VAALLANTDEIESAAIVEFAPPRRDAGFLVDVAHETVARGRLDHQRNTIGAGTVELHIGTVMRPVIGDHRIEGAGGAPGAALLGERIGNRQIGDPGILGSHLHCPWRRGYPPRDEYRSSPGP